MVSMSNGDPTRLKPGDCFLPHVWHFLHVNHIPLTRHFGCEAIRQTHCCAPQGTKFAFALLLMSTQMQPDLRAEHSWCPAQQVLVAPKSPPKSMWDCLQQGRINTRVAEGLPLACTVLMDGDRALCSTCALRCWGCEAHNRHGGVLDACEAAMMPGSSKGVSKDGRKCISTLLLGL